MTRSVSAVLILVYSVILVRIMVLRDIPTVRIGHLMFRFGGGDANGNANFVPFKTIVSYLTGSKGLIIVGINIAGNIGLLVPFGFLASIVFPKMTWKWSLSLSVAVGLLVEGAQVLLSTGIFDVDDVILNGLGIMIGYGVYLAYRAACPLVPQTPGETAL